MAYVALKYFHVTLAVASVILFLVRAEASVNRSRMPSTRFRVLAHLVDTLLLGLGIALVYRLSLNPLHTPWLAAKLLAIAAYIGFGTVVMKAKNKQIKKLALVSALVLIACIFLVAIFKNPF